MMKSRPRRLHALLLLSCLVLQALAGCTGVLDSTVRPRAELEVFPTLIQEGEMVTLDARDSTAVQGVIVSYSWDFGDGTSAETVVGFTSHSYEKFGQYTIRLTVTNDQGGSDESSATVVVNGAPVINITMPTQIRSGDTAILDASDSYDPEGRELEFIWDLNGSYDADFDGDAYNDIDSTDAKVMIETTSSGIMRGVLHVTDPDGASAQQLFELNVSTRAFNVVWIIETIELNWDDYLDQGESWEANATPGESGLVLATEAELVLDRDVAPPHDNFSLILNIFDDGFTKRVETEAGNYTRNEPAKATMLIESMNIQPEEGLFRSDSEEALLYQLLHASSTVRGQGDWMWTVIAQQSEPDPFIGEIDPDPGNDWSLTVSITIARPSLTEVALPDSNE